jgi:hypothetical protein
MLSSLSAKQRKALQYSSATNAGIEFGTAAHVHPIKVDKPSVEDIRAYAHMPHALFTDESAAHCATECWMSIGCAYLIQAQMLGLLVRALESTASSNISSIKLTGRHFNDIADLISVKQYLKPVQPHPSTLHLSKASTRLLRSEPRATSTSAAVCLTPPACESLQGVTFSQDELNTVMSLSSRMNLSKSCVYRSGSSKAHCFT